MSKTKVKLRICDIDCTISSDDSEEYIRTISDEIDRAISAVLKKNDRISLSMAAIITAMTYCDESIKAKAKLAELATAEKHMTGEYHRLKQEADSAQAQAEQLRSEIQTLHAFLAENKYTDQLSIAKESPSAINHGTTKDMIFRCINGKPSYVQKTLTENEHLEIFDIPNTGTVSMKDAHTLEELYNSINTTEDGQTADTNSETSAYISTPVCVNDPQTKQSKQSRHKKKQHKKVQKQQNREQVHHTRSVSPAQRAEHPAAEVLTGDFTRPKSPYEPKLPSDHTFIGYFEKN